MEHKFLRLFDNGVWKGNPERKIKINGEEYDLDEYAKEHGIELPEGKKFINQINTDIQEKDHADLESTFRDGSAEEHGDGDSESTE